MKITFDLRQLRKDTDRILAERLEFESELVKSLGRKTNREWSQTQKKLLED